MPSFEEAKSAVNIIDVARPYCGGFTGRGNCVTAKQNPFRDEKTSSLCFYVDSQRFHDFGSGQSGDVFDFIACVENITSYEAKERIAVGNSVPIKSYSESTAQLSRGGNPLQVENVEISRKEPIDFTLEFKKFALLDLTNELHSQELAEIFPKECICNLAAKDLLRLPIRFDARNKTLVVAIHDASGKIVCFRKRRSLLSGKSKKWLANPGSKAKTSFFRIRTAAAPIYILEGIKDGLNALLLGLDFIAIPSAGYRSFNAEELALIKGRELVFVPDTDNVGRECMDALAEQVQKMAVPYTLDLKDFLIAWSAIEISQDLEKIDFTDALKLFCIQNSQFMLSDQLLECFLAYLEAYVNQKKE